MPSFGQSLALVLLSAAAFAQTQDPLQSIISDLRAGHYKDASSAIEEKLRTSPNDARLWTLDGFALAHLGDEPPALVSYQRALDLLPDYLPALEGAAEIEFKTSGKHAEVLIRNVLKIRPNDQTSHAMLGSLLSKRGDCAEAVNEFSRSRPLIDEKRDALQEYGSCLVKLKKLAEAIPIFERIREIAPESARARYNLAMVQSLNGAYQSVIAILRPAAEKGEADADSLQLLAEAYEATSATPQAVSTLRQAIVSAPGEIKYYVDFANLCLIHNAFQVGVDMLDAGLSRKPQAAELYLARGILYTQMGRYDQSESDFARAEKLNPNLLFGSAARSMQELQRNNLEEAESSIRARIQKKPDEPFLRYLLAETLQRKGAAPHTAEFAEALKSAQEAVRLQPDFTLARDVLSRLYLQENKVEEATEQSWLAFEEDPTDQAALYHYIVALRKRHRNEDLSALTKKLAELRERARIQEAEEHKYSFVEVPQP